MRFSYKDALVWALLVLIAPVFVAAQGDAKKGKDLYTVKCVACHNPTGIVKPAIEKMFSVKIRPLASKEVQSYSDEQLQRRMVEGNGKMASVEVTYKEAADIIAYLRTMPKEKK